MSIIYRYGVSLLSRKNHIKAKPEELMIDKETGQILLKQENGKILSYDAMTRFQASFNTISATAERRMIMGKILSIVPDNLALPRCIASGDEILVSEVANLGSIKKVVVQLDVDVIDTDSTFGDIKESDKVKATVKLQRKSGKTETVTMPVLKLADNVIAFDNADETSITSITIFNEDEADNASSQYILQNILVLTA